MRTIIGNIKILADEEYANKKLEFILCNQYGKQLSTLDTNGQIATKKTTETNDMGDFSVTLYETEKSKLPIYYKMIFIDNLDIQDLRLFIQEGSESINFLKLLFPMPKLQMFYEEKNQNIIFNDSVFLLFDRFFVNENIFTNNDEKNLLQEYVNHADNIRKSEIIKKLDKYLGSI